MTINERIFYLLDTQDILQKEFAKAIDIPIQTVNSWRKRKNDPPAEFIVPIANFLHVSVDYLLTGTEQTASVINATDLIQDRLKVDERNLLNTYRDLTDTGKTMFLDLSKEIWADHRLPKEKLSPSQNKEQIG